MRVSRERNRRRVAAGACLISLTAILTKKKCSDKHFFYAFDAFFLFARPFSPARPRGSSRTLRRAAGGRSRDERSRAGTFFFQTPWRS